MGVNRPELAKFIAIKGVCGSESSLPHVSEGNFKLRGQSREIGGGG
jgi:hypothetical protein